ncbi:TerD family protein [Actinoallomurus sp. NPDC052308]|uniref:protein kinase domain-containing protein n=1 Tax=Actinoallomurus sp. NPDC052308 TaxID=3155530 RepID=UPI0034443558
MILIALVRGQAGQECVKRGVAVRDRLLGGRYRLVRQLGEGGMGQVWEAQDETLGRRVAVKVISLLAGGGGRGDEARARFLREARITARLQHPNIVTVHDLGETGTEGDRVPFLVMELVRGEGLDAIRRRGAVTLPEAARWGAQICDALADAHNAGIMHRDIKPSNILITPSGIVKVLDFGVARAADPYATADRITQTGFIVGTPPYMAPEQARGLPEPRSDLYALGCLLFELITGRLPFQAPDTVGYLSAHLTQEPPAPSSVAPDTPPAWNDLVLTLLHKDPTQRYPNATDLAQALRRLDHAPEPRPPAHDGTRPFTTPGTTPLPPVVSAPGPNSVPPASMTTPARLGGTVDLSKRQAISLQKGDGGTLTAVRMVLGWQAAPRRGLFGSRTGAIDLDASAVLFADEQPVDVVFFHHLVSDDGSVRHTGDDLVGGDDEAILVDLQRVPAHINQIIFTVSSFTGQTFAEVQNTFCRLVDETNGQELARYTLTGGGQHTGQIMAKVQRAGSGWQMKAVGEPANGRTFQDLMPHILPHL